VRAKSLVVAVVLLLPPLSGHDRDGTSIAFKPQEGLTLSKTFQVETRLLFEDGKVWSGDEEPSTIEMDMQVLLQEEVVVTDTYVAVTNNRPQELRRTFDTLRGSERSWGSLLEDSEEENTSELEGHTVLFEWNDEDKKYAVAFAEAEADEELLEGLEEDMDLRGYLPAGEVEEGDSWELDASDAKGLVTFGGDLVIWPDMEEEDAVDKAFEGAFEDLDGTITCTYLGDKQVQGRSLAIIEIEIEGKGFVEAEGDTGSVAATLQLDGHLEWYLDAGHFSSIELDGEMECTISEKTEGVSVLFTMRSEMSISGEAEED